MSAYRRMKWAAIPGALALALALVLAGCATLRADSEAAPPAPRPALWLLSDDDTKIYLFGTIHILPKGLKWRTPALEKAIAEADELVLETKMGTDFAATGRMMMTMGSSPGLPPLAERVPADKRAALGAMIASAGFPPARLDTMETWAAALMLAAGSLRKLGFNAGQGVEKSIEGTHKANARPVSGIETVAQQFGFFDAMTEDAQRAFLVGAIEDPQGSRAQLDAMITAWAAGDVDGIAKTFDSETALAPELREVLMTRRNAAWADWIEAKLATPGTILVAVGAGHLAGKDSLQKRLEAKGLKVKRLQ